MLASTAQGNRWARGKRGVGGGEGEGAGERRADGMGQSLGPTQKAAAPERSTARAGRCTHVVMLATPTPTNTKQLFAVRGTLPTRNLCVLGADWQTGAARKARIHRGGWNECTATAAPLANCVVLALDFFGPNHGSTKHDAGQCRF